MSRLEFNETVQVLFISAVAAAAGIDSTNAVITQIVTLRRSARLLLAEAIRVDISITSAAADPIPTVDALNVQMALVGLPSVASWSELPTSTVLTTTPTPSTATPTIYYEFLACGVQCPAGTNQSGELEKCNSTCGDGLRSILEACDDGNQVSGDGCSASCEYEQPPDLGSVWECQARAPAKEGGDIEFDRISSCSIRRVPSRYL